MAQLVYRYEAYAPPTGHFKYSEGDYGIKMLMPRTMEELYRLAILYIPKNVIYYEVLPDSLMGYVGGDKDKKRAQMAQVVDIVAVTRDENDRLELKHVDYGMSLYAASIHDHLMYHSGRIVFPRERMSLDDKPCASGIHYYSTPNQLLEGYLESDMIFGWGKDGNVMTNERFNFISSNTRDTICEWYETTVERDKFMRVAKGRDNSCAFFDEPKGEE